MAPQYLGPTPSCLEIVRARENASSVFWLNMIVKSFLPKVKYADHILKCADYISKCADHISKCADHIPTCADHISKSTDHFPKRDDHFGKLADHIPNHLHKKSLPKYFLVF